MEENANEVIRQRLDNVRESVSPPVTEAEILGKWYPVVLRSKKSKTLQSLLILALPFARLIMDVSSDLMWMWIYIVSDFGLFLQVVIVA